MGMHNRRRARTALGASAAALAVIVGASAQAASQGSRSVVPCGRRVLSHPFAAFGDPRPYFRITNGGFEAGGASWTLGGGATVVAGNEPFHVGGAGDSHALRLGAHGTAASAPLCAGTSEPQMRLFARGTGPAGTRLRIDAVVSNLSGQPMRTVTLRVAAGNAGAWLPTPPIVFGSSASRAEVVQFRFSVEGGNSATDWRIDDVYVDPWRNCC
jgi:hypothetical protein